MARYIAKNMVAAGLASRCQVSLAYAIGVAQPVMVQVDTFGTGKVCADDCLAMAIPLVFGLTPKQIRAYDYLQRHQPGRLVKTRTRNEWQLREHESFKINEITSK